MLFLQMLFDALVIELPDKFSEDIMEKAHLDIQGAIHGMMNDSIMFHPPFVYALEDACYRNKNLKLDANVISMASKTGVQHPIGIMLLEKQLLDDGSKEPSRKRKRSEHNQNENFLAWIELAKLYRSIDKYDFVHTIFSSQITKQEYARIALECEERNDYAKALKYYNQVRTIHLIYLFYADIFYVLFIINLHSIPSSTSNLMKSYYISMCLNIRPFSKQCLA